MSRFIQIHTLTSYPASLLNRDDAGFAKRIPFGDSTRTRISSQCLKRHWRGFEGRDSLRDAGAPMSIRSRITFDHEIFKALKAEGVDEVLAREVTEQIKAAVFGKSDKARAREDAAEKKPKKGADADEAATSTPAGRTEQVTVLGRPEVDYFLKHAREVCAEKPTVKDVGAKVTARFKDARRNLEALRTGAGLDAAMFGRMVTSDVLSRCDAAVHVAHAFTVHGEFAETDYFSAIDELEREREDAQLGSGHIGTAELTSGLFYGYIAIDLPLLVSNIEGCHANDWQKADRALAAEVTRRLVHMVATVSPGAKLGSTAPHAYAQAVLLETCEAQPRTLANAFLKGVGKGDLLANAYGALRTHLDESDGMYGWDGHRAHAAMHAGNQLPASRFGEKLDLPALAKWAARQVVEG
jgi:CRISPR system Cascade subunit CasC